MTESWKTTTELAEALGVSLATASRLCRLGHIKCARLPGTRSRYRIDADTFARFVAPFTKKRKR